MLCWINSFVQCNNFLSYGRYHFRRLYSNITCFIYDEGYDDFEDRGRWTIGKYYIIVVDGEYYQFWEEAGLTELQESHFYDQSFIKVREAIIKKTVWEGVE